MERTNVDVVEEMERYLNTRQVSERTGIPEGTLRFWRHMGEGPKSHTLGRKRVVYPLSSLNEWLQAQATNNVSGGVA
ncbi:helix-turn-helix transcriptional regulator [Rhodococcus oryzae]|uniref:helix-turn-helix transcriptional regulator n=1 Tax=Rhodococcus oryzae TaxID=2571143 RepID=UPI0037210995